MIGRRRLKRRLHRLRLRLRQPLRLRLLLPLRLRNHRAENGEPIKYQDEGYSSYSTAMMDNPHYPVQRDVGTPNSRSARNADARALFKERLRQRQRALLREKEVMRCAQHTINFYPCLGPRTHEDPSRDLESRPTAQTEL